MPAHVPDVSVAEKLVDCILAIAPERMPAAMRQKCEDLAVDVIGLCLTARNQDYVKSALAGCDDDGPCTAIGHARMLSAASAAFVNGTAAHGEDFDDTFEGGPVHAGAVIVPAVLAACERHRPDGTAALTGIAVGIETMCRLGLVTPKHSFTGPRTVFEVKHGFFRGFAHTAKGNYEALVGDFGERWVSAALAF